MRNDFRLGPIEPMFVEPDQHHFTARWIVIGGAFGSIDEPEQVVPCMRRTNDVGRDFREVSSATMLP